MVISRTTRLTKMSREISIPPWVLELAFSHSTREVHNELRSDNVLADPKRARLSLRSNNLKAHPPTLLRRRPSLICPTTTYQLQR